MKPSTNDGTPWGTTFPHSSLAETELTAACDYYEKQSPGLGRVFLREIHQALVQLAAAPESAPVLRDDFRKKTLFRFPYSLIYRCQNRQVQILTLMHQRRDPEHIARHLKDL